MCGSWERRRAAASAQATRDKLKEIKTVDATELDAGQVVEDALDAAVGLVDYEEVTVEDKHGVSKDTGGASVITWS